MPFIKTKIGEHDYHKPACAEHCWLGGRFCPFINAKRKTVKGIVRWTDIADDANALVTGEPRDEAIVNGVRQTIGYSPDFTKKPDGSDRTVENGSSSTPSDENVLAEYSAAGYTCWGDGSGFEYDNMSRNVIGPGGPTESVYDITTFGIEHTPLQFSAWNAWIDKFQYDYRFGRVSDTNAECILFPNVDNPWMFTEYVFKGIGGETGKCAWRIPAEYVVEPPVYDPCTLRLLNGDHEVQSTDFDGKYATDCDESTLRSDEQSSSSDGDGSPTEKYLVREYRRIANWSDLTTWTLDEAHGDIRTQETLNKESYGLQVHDAGIRLYRARIPVQSVKWGEHGNIPPHTLDMTAPKSWLDPASNVTNMKAVYDAVIGSAIYSPYEGKIEWVGRQAYIHVGMDFEAGPSATSGGVTYRQYYSYSGGTRTEVAMPQQEVRGEMQTMKPAVTIMPDDGTAYGEYCHAGCANAIGIGGRLYCKLIRNGNFTHGGYFDHAKCLAQNGYGGDEAKCPQYIPTSLPKIATYQDTRMGVDQLSGTKNTFASAMLLATTGGVGGALAGASMMGYQSYDKFMSYYSNLGKRGDVEVTYVLRYEPVMGAKDKARLNKKKYNEFGRDVQIVPGTGRYAIDTEQDANPFSGGDTNAYDDIDTLSFHRFFTSVMHCSNSRYCNAIVGKEHGQGFSFQKRAGGDDDCRYFQEWSNGVEGCPYNCAPKRGIEFARCSNAISEHVASMKIRYGSYQQYHIWDFAAGEHYAETNGMYRCVEVGSHDWRVFGNVAYCQKTSKICLVAVQVDGDTSSNRDYNPEWSGAALLARIPSSASDDGWNEGIENALPSGFMLFCELRTELTYDTVIVKDEHNEDKEKHCKVYTPSDAFYWFQPLDNAGNKLILDEEVIPTLRQTVDANGYWFCKTGVHGVPTTNCMMVDNNSKFIGGWHPEYKDYSKIGPEFMQDIVTEESREGQGKGDYIHNGDYTPIPLSTTKKGYWIDQSGLYILDERSIGADQPIASDGAREDVGGGVCVSFKKSNSQVDPETGKRKQPKTINGAVFANDPYNHVMRMRSESRPKFSDEETGDEYYAPLIVNNRYLLPTMRHAIYCPNCDYYLPYKYHDVPVCPWCGSEYVQITGSDGGELEDGDTWAANAPIIRKFFKIYSIGNADVYAPAGTALKTDAYFWRHQAQITNGTKRQIAHRLGDSNKKEDVTALTVGDGGESGGAYKFDKMSAQSEMTLGYPEGLGKFIRVPKGAETDTETRYRYGKSYMDWKPDDDPSIDAMWNPFMPRHMVPEWYDASDDGDEDEGMIAPYTQHSDDALKLVSQEQMRVFRNAIEPVYAYTNSDSYSGDYPTHRASYDQREAVDQPIIWQGRKSTVPMCVLACTDDGIDSYQTYFSGDYVYGNVREYFPSGYTWWMMNNTLGGRYTFHLEGDYHMDLGPTILEDGTIVNGRRMSGGSGGEYTTSTRTVAKCAVSLYGLLPLDKEIVKAYLIIRPSGLDPSKNPIGRSWTGGPVMYHHYHALPKSHYDHGNERHLHGTAGYPNDQYFDEDGNFVNPHPGQIIYTSDDIRYQDDSAYRLWGRESHFVDDDRYLYYDVDVKKSMTNIPCLYDTEFHRNVGTRKTSVTAYGSSETLGDAYSDSSFGSKAGFTMYNLTDTEAKRRQKYQYIVVDSDGNAVLKYPESVVWKTDTTETIEDTIDNHMATVELKVSDGTQDNAKSHIFRQSDSYLYMNQMPRQSQAITGYFDMSWTNTMGYVYDEYTVQRKSGGTEWGNPIVYQDETPSVNGAAMIGYQGGEVSAGSIGQVARCIDITDIVQRMYEKRIERTFSASGGCSYEDVIGFRFYETLTKGNLRELDADVARQNLMEDVQEDGTYLLTDVVSYPDVDGDMSAVPEADPDGDKYVLSKGMSVVRIRVQSPFNIDSSNNRYVVSVNGTEMSGQLATGSYNGIDDGFLAQLKEMFAGAEVNRISVYIAEASSDGAIAVKSCPESSCYGVLNIEVGVYEVRQDRTWEVGSYVKGYHPRNLLGADTNGVWTYTTCNETSQSFTVDMLRAPLCRSQRDYRYQGGSSDYSSVKCPNTGCKAHTMGCSVAANMSNKHFNPNSPKCPLCGADLSGQSGIVSVPGDGIMTYDYDAPFDSNPFITRLVVKPMAGTSYRVFVRVHGRYAWRALADVSLKPVEDERTEYESRLNPDGSSFIESVSLNSNPESGRIVVRFRDRSVRGRYVKVECDSPMHYNMMQYDIDPVSGTTYQVIARGNFADFGMFSVEGETAQIGDETMTYTIVATELVGEDGSQLRISLDRPAPRSNFRRKIRFRVSEQTGGIEEFKVYGKHYKTEESSDAENCEGSGKKYLTITDMEDEFVWRMNTQTTKYKLPEPPNQIYEVAVGANGVAGVVLTETDRIDSLRWITKTEKLNVTERDVNDVKHDVTYEISRIVGGNYYYDIENGKLCIPREDQNGNDWSTYEDSIKGKNIVKSYIPNTLVLRYCGGNGKSLKFKAKADGHGPSYMLEKNAIQELSKETIASLPSNGKLCKMMDVNGSVVPAGKDFPWVCYNDTPSVLSIETQSKSNSIQGTTSYNAGEFKLPYMTGKEIKDKMNDDNAFVEVFGPHSEYCRGQCETEVTLTGAPNQIVSGSLTFVALPETERTIDVGGKTLHYKERTGGIDNGVLIVSCAPLTAGKGGRMTLCYSLPELVIYAKEAKTIWT